MIKAKATMKDGRVALVLGLSAGNIERLEAGHPIFFDIAALKMGEADRLGAVTIFYGADDAALTRNLKPFIGPDTDVIVSPRGDTKPQ